MPRTPKVASKANSATKTVKAAATATKTRAVAAKRSRRSPYDLLQALQTQREQLQKTMEERLGKLDHRIATLEQKHEHKIKVSELLKSKSPEELQLEMEEMKKQQSILRKALKQAKK